MTTTLLPTAHSNALIWQAYAAGYAAPEDEDEATMALIAFCRKAGYREGDPYADAWCAGWHVARRLQHAADTGLVDGMGDMLEGFVLQPCSYAAGTEEADAYARGYTKGRAAVEGRPAELEFVHTR